MPPTISGWRCIFTNIEGLYRALDPGFFIWALVIIYAQVYVGVHFPLDVACGAGIGLLFGYLSGQVV